MSLTAEQRAELVDRTQLHDCWLARRRAKRAVKELATALRNLPDAGLAGALVALVDCEHRNQKIARKALDASVREPEGVRALTDAWLARRSPLIVDVLRDAQADIGHSSALLALSFALDQGPSDIAALDEQQLAAVISCAADDDTQVATPARSFLLAALDHTDDAQVSRTRGALMRLASTPPGIQSIVDAWTERRRPELLDALLRTGARVDPVPARNIAAVLATDQLPAHLTGFDVDHGIALVAALDDNEPSVRERAAETLRTAKRQPVVDALARAWADAQNPLLDKLVRANATLPSDPDLALLVSIAQRRPDVIDREGPAGIDQLLALLDEPEFMYGDEAHEVLGALHNTACHEYVCALTLSGDSRARDAAVRGRYLPSGDPERAAFLLLTEQWERYGEFDFDGRLIASYYASSSPTSQAQLRQLARRSGHTGVLRMVLGGNHRDRVRRISRSEAEYLVESLISQKQFGDAFKLAFELPFEWGLNAAVRLREAGWIPERPDDRALHDELIAAHRRGDAAQVEQLASHLPLAIRRAEAYIQGGVNSVSFAPDEMELALGTNARQVGLWHFQHGRLLWRQGLHRSVGHVLHAGSGRVLAAERTNNTSNTCRAYEVTRQGVVRLGAHSGSINGLGVLPGGSVVTAGRDGHLRFWANGSTPALRVTNGSYADDWPRAMALSTDARHVASVHRGVSLIDLTAQRLAGSTALASAASAAGFGPGGDDVVVGMHNGSVHVCRHAGNRLRPVGQLAAHAGKVVAITPVPERKLLITAATDGRVRAYAWPSGNKVGELHVRLLKSVTASPHGDWLAMGHEDMTSLWDFRVADVPGLFALPLVDTTPAHLGLLETAAAGLPTWDNGNSCLTTITAMLRYRFRHDIEISDAPVAIRAGKFDIELG